MEKTARSKGYQGALSLVAVTLLASLAAQQTYAQDGPIPASRSRVYRDNAPALQADLAVNFNDRWDGAGSTTKEFVLGSDGVASAEGNAGAAAKAETSFRNPVHNIGAAQSAFFHVPDAKPEAMIGARPTGSLTTASGSSQTSGGRTTTTECGPSPLKPDAVKASVADSARKHGVDEGFAIAIAWTESRFDQERNSPKGARGPMQLMPETAARFGVQDVCDPAQNIEGGMKYLRFLLDEFQNPLLVAAAYNSGEGRIYEYGGIPPFHETVGYVAKVVNFQLDLPMPSDKRKGSGIARDVATTNSSDAGVIAVEKTGKFVGGVMHF